MTKRDEPSVPMWRGATGGRIVAQGTPEQVKAVKASHTGRFLAARVTG